MRSLTLAQAANRIYCGGSYPSSLISGYCTDSRLVKNGELFFALKGERVDGHHFLKEVKQRGALAAVVSKEFRGEVNDLFLLKVDDPLEALQQLAKGILLASPVRIVAITGSIGKTSTKEFTKTLLATKYRVAASPGNSNSQVGIPLTILNETNGEEEIVILEMGMTVPGNLTKLIQLAPPEVAVITKVALVHACNFESIEEIGRTKGEILSHPRTRLAILSRDIPNFNELCRIGNCPKVSFSTAHPEADYSLDPHDLSLLEARLEKYTLSLGPLPIPGKHNRHNLLAAIGVARYFDVSWDQIKHGVSSLSLPDRRLQFVQHKGMLFLNDSYNASELSVKAALETLPPPEMNGRKIAVLGSMMELGKFSHDCHYRVGEHALKYVERMYCLGEECLPIVDLWTKMERPISLFKRRSELVACLKNELQPSDVVLLKGSRSKELWKVLEEL